MMEFLTSGNSLFAILSLAFIAAAAYITGSSKGKASAEKKANDQRTKEILQAIEKASAEKQKASSEAKNVTESVTRMSDSDVDSRLRDKWRLPPGGGD